MSLFQRYGYIYKPVSGGSWLSANEKWKLTDSEILKAIAGAHRFYLGCRSGKSTRFAVLDIDSGSRYHSKSELEKLVRVLSAAGLSRSCLYRSSYSGGWHLYIFFDEPVNSGDLRKQLLELLTLHDFQVQRGTLEVFPNPGHHSLGYGLRLPLQPGWAWIDKDTLAISRERNDLDATAALELFLDDLDADANSYAAYRILKAYVQDLQARRQSAALRGRSTEATNVVPFRKNEAKPGQFIDFVRSVFSVLPPGIIPDNWYRGRLYHLSGLTASSQRADAIYCLGHYFFYGDPSRDLSPLGYGYEQEREWAIKEFLSSRHNGQSKDINCGRADAIAQVERAAHWKPAHRNGSDQKKYTSHRPVSWIRENANRKNSARKRISNALENLKKLRRPITTVELQQTAGCSRETLYKHADIWRKDYEDLADGFFAICTDEYNAVVGAASSESTPPTATLSSDMPQGRLAARRVAFEVSSRANREKIRSQKAAIQSRDASEKEWRGKAHSLTSEPVSELTVERIKLLLLLLVTFLSTAPTYEDAVALAGYIADLRQELTLRSIRSEEASENEWRAKVQSLTSEPPSDVTIQRLKLLLVLLVTYISTAPTYEDAVTLGNYLVCLRQEFKRRLTGPHSLNERQPPDS